MFDMSQINEDEFHIDLGFMYGISSQEPDVSGGPPLPRPLRAGLRMLCERTDSEQKPCNSSALLEYP